MKYFTPLEATLTLPLVRRIVEDILSTGNQLREFVRSAGGHVSGHPEFEQKVREINGYFAELEELGCSYKDWNFTIGLVDFPSIIDGETVMLCWRSDESNLQYYHGVEDGFAGRKPIPNALLHEHITN
ncbi:MAG: DUF2203 domain-containing protein [Ignavibacteria bacterium]|nr:DUF2203 domain-containing protein [Ignavibacteria bacterium]